MRSAPLAALAAALAACAVPDSDAPARPRPNILFIMTDDHAAHALSCYGSRINQTPNLDRIAAEGMRFANCFVTNSLCGPSRATILTGKYSHRHGFRRNGDPFDGDQPHVVKYLRAAGYQTAIVGKWHLKTEPTGFDYSKVLPGQGRYHDPDFLEMGVREKHQGYVSDLITDAALEWLDRRDGDKPFLLLYHHKAPHRRWFPGPDHESLYDGDPRPEPATLFDDYRGRGTPARAAEMTVATHLDEHDLKVSPPAGLEGDDLVRWKYQRYMEDYLRCVASVDDNVGRVLDYLDHAGLSDDTIVIYTSDQGFFLGDHGWYDKRFMYEEALRTPLLVRYPGVTEPGSVQDAMALNLDFAQTLLDIAGEPQPDDMQGRSLVPLLRGDAPADWRRSMYYHYYEYPAVHMVHKHRGVRTERYKLIHFYEIDEWELFDLAQDPHELRSVWDDPTYAGVRGELEAELNRLREELGDET